MGKTDRAAVASSITPVGGLRGQFAEPAVMRRIILFLSIIMCGLALAYLLFKIRQLTALPAGFDFRFLWVAGDMWFDGANPYGPDYQSTGQTKIDVGHVPVLWPYPPTWWIIVTPLGALDLGTANLIWNLFGLAIVIAMCGLLTNAFEVAFPERSQAIAELTGGWVRLPIFSLLFFLVAVLEATAILFSVGQTTLVIALGISLMLWGRVHQNTFFEAVGLALVLLKPQIGAPFVLLYVLLDTQSRKALLLAVLFSILLTLPSLVTAPSSVLDFMRNVIAYDEFTVANLPQSMTGIRLIIWELSGADIGSSAATLGTLAIALMLCAGPTRLPRSADVNTHTWQIFGLTSAVIVALAPLHIYDFVLLSIPLALTFRGRIVSAIFAAFGALLIWRSENLVGIWAFHAPGVEIFPSSRLATIGALLFLLAVVDIVLHLNRHNAGSSKSW